MAKLTTIDRVKVYVASGAELIEIDNKTAAVLCELAEYGYRAHFERGREKANAEWYARMSSIHLAVMFVIVVVTAGVAISRAARWI